MNKLADIVSNSLIGNDFVNIRIAGKYYKVLSPTPRTLGNMLRSMNKVQEVENIEGVIRNAENNCEMIIEAISVCLYTGDSFVTRIKRNRFKRRAIKCYPAELREAFEDIIKLIYAVDFFLSAQVVKQTVQAMARQKASEDTPYLGR